MVVLQKNGVQLNSNKNTGAILTGDGLAISPGQFIFIQYQVPRLTTIPYAVAPRSPLSLPMPPIYSMTSL